jgi:hypothetical protein
MTSESQNSLLLGNGSKHIPEEANARNNTGAVFSTATPRALLNEVAVNTYDSIRNNR